jgi:hypothetical protein
LAVTSPLPVRSADQLDHHVRARMARQFGHVVDPVEARDVDAAVLVALTRGDRDDLDRPARTARDQLGIGVDQANDARTHGSKAGKSNAQRFGHVSISWHSR